MNEDELDAFVNDAVDFMNQAIASCSEMWDISSYTEFALNQDTGILSLSGPNPPIGCRFQFVGTYHTATGGWRWSWANPTLNDEWKGQMQDVKKFGEMHGVKLITEEAWECDTEDSAWFMTAISTKILNGISAYRAPMNETLFVYVVVTSVDWL